MSKQTPPTGPNAGKPLRVLRAAPGPKSDRFKAQAAAGKAQRDALVARDLHPPGVAERAYTAEEPELLRAAEQFRAELHLRFLSHTHYLQLFHQLGYRRVAPSRFAGPDPAAPTAGETVHARP